jgi:hypothetical protein
MGIIDANAQGNRSRCDPAGACQVGAGSLTIGVRTGAAELLRRFGHPVNKPILPSGQSNPSDLQLSATALGNWQRIAWMAHRNDPEVAQLRVGELARHATPVPTPFMPSCHTINHADIRKLAMRGSRGGSKPHIIPSGMPHAGRVHILRSERSAWSQFPERHRLLDHGTRCFVFQSCGMASVGSNAGLGFRGHVT